MKNSTLCYIEKDGCYLMLHRTKKEKDENHDKWIGIGGKMEEGESPFDCILREAKEEIGATLEEVKYRGIVTFVSNIYGTEYMHLFHCKKYSGTLFDTCTEGVPRWVKKEDVTTLPIWEGDKLFLSLLNEKCEFFSLKLVYEEDKLVYHKLDYAK